jgi:hypothetical protein
MHVSDATAAATDAPEESLTTVSAGIPLAQKESRRVRAGGASGGGSTYSLGTNLDNQEAACLSGFPLSGKPQSTDVRYWRKKTAVRSICWTTRRAARDNVQEANSVMRPATSGLTLTRYRNLVGQRRFPQMQFTQFASETLSPAARLAKAACAAKLISYVSECTEPSQYTALKLVGWALPKLWQLQQFSRSS